MRRIDARKNLRETKRGEEKQGEGEKKEKKRNDGGGWVGGGVRGSIGARNE